MSEAVDALEAEVEGQDYREVELVEGVNVRVLPASEWRASVLRAMREGDLDEVAEKVFHPEDVDLWYDADPRQREVEAFLERLTDEGKSSSSGKSSKRSRRK